MFARILILVSILTALFGIASFAETESVPLGSPQTLFQKGLAAYQNKQYAEARDDFQKVLESGAMSPSVLHNLALADYQLDQKPMALALWRKALSLQPSFLPAREGRAFLEGKMQMRPLESDSLSLWTHRNLESISLFDLLGFNALLLSAVGWLWLSYAGQRTRAVDEESAMPAFPTVPLTLSLIFVGGLTLTGLKLKDGYFQRATVTASKTSVRSLPSDDGVGLFDISGGNEVLVRREQSGWAQIQNGDGASGWVKSSEIFVTSER